MKKIFITVFLLFGLIFLFGCFKTQPQSDLTISLNGSYLEDVKADSEVKDEHIFKSYMNRIALSKIIFVTFGEKIHLEFEGEAPNFIYLTDSIINSDGEYLYDTRLDMKIEYVEEDSKNYNWVVGEHPSGYMIAAAESEKGIFRGIKIDAFFGEQKTTYLLVIQTAVKK
ncbi:MAG: hypothetical protein PHQ32_05895 [Firmicutes bacterium]|nr:hypothetical protein [Bacillota bacterium]